MTKQFNLLRYKELLELEKNKKISFLDLELLTYKTSIEYQICYNHKENYFSLIGEYFKKKLTGYEFRSRFLKMETQDQKTAYTIKRDFQKLENFRLADNLKDFSNLIIQISTLCLEYDEIWDETIEGMSESEFYSLVNEYFSIYKTISSFPNNNLSYEKLIYRSFRNLAGIIFLILPTNALHLR